MALELSPFFSELMNRIEWDKVNKYMRAYTYINVLRYLIKMLKIEQFKVR